MPSTIVQSIDYEAAHNRLTVVFTSDRIYEYYMVPADIASAFQQSNSKGRFFNRWIRDRYVCREKQPSEYAAPALASRSR